MKSSIVSGENRGSINNILLKALQTGDKYGYEINKEIEIKSKGRYFLKEASLYSGLKRLEASGHITSYWRDGELGIRRHYYSITEKGLEKLNSSKFTWDNSKEFIQDMFKNEKVENTILNNFQKNENEKENVTTSPLNNKVNNLSENSDKNEINAKNPQASETNNAELKNKTKNPFQYEVNPLQQSIFDTLIDNKTENSYNQKDENSNNLTQNSYAEFNLQENNNIVNKQEKEETNIKENNNVNTNSEHTIPTSENLSAAILKTSNLEKKSLDSEMYADMLNSYTHNSYSSSLEKESNNLDIFSLLNKQQKENDSSIVFDKSTNNSNEKFSNITNKSEQKESLFENSVKEENFNNQNLITNNNNDTLKESVENKDDEKLYTENQQDITDINENKTNNINLHNIFGNLLVNNNEEELEKQEVEPIKEESQEISIKQKPELPRIDMRDNVNISLNSSRVKIETPPNLNNYIKDDPILSSGTHNTPSVKQYLYNVHKKNIISNATNINDEINLEGIKVREYTKMNNKLIKNSNYIYINKLNVFLAFIFTALILIESSIAITTLALSYKIDIFSIVFYSFVILGILSYLIYQLNIFKKDKFKVLIKKFSLKNNLFYTILIFIVCTIIFVCINIFQGMNSNNLSDFILKILLELLIFSNIILYPIVKSLCFKINRFSN